MQYRISSVCHDYCGLPCEVGSFCQTIEDLEACGILMDELADWYGLIAEYITGFDVAAEHNYGVYRLATLEATFREALCSWAENTGEFDLSCAELDDNGLTTREVRISLSPVLLEVVENYDLTGTICEYVENSLQSYLEESQWHYGFRSTENGQVLESIKDWPTPRSLNGTIEWTKEEHSFRPILWFGPDNSMPLDPWTIGDVLPPLFKAGGDTWEIISCLIEDPNECFLIWYTGEKCCEVPDTEEILSRCPVILTCEDDEKYVQEKINRFFLEKIGC